MIIHLSAAGVPTSWSIEALYKSSYGVALCAARAWHAQSIDERGDTPQCVMELDASDSGWAVKRIDLMMGAQHMARQKPDNPSWLVQTHSAPLPLSDSMGVAIADALRAKLIEVGYMIPRAEWEVLYPAQALTSRRFADFNAAHDAWRDANADAAERMPFALRWTPFMETPKGYKLPYGRGEDHVCERRSSGKWSRIDPPELAGIEDIDAVVHLLNSGWTPAEVKVLMTKEPVG